MPRALEIAVRRAILERYLSVIVIPSDVVLKPAARCILSRSRAMKELASDDAIFTCDGGLPTVWAARYLAINGRRHLLGSFRHGSLTNAMEQAIGAQAAFSQRQVISLSGDDGFTMLMGAG
jgi:thiamine pyrophosphate-dependent acetolactate synthase large subunit-like protein